MIEDNNIDYRPGARVYIVVPERFFVVPAVIIERHTKETAEGQTVSYILDLGEEGTRAVSSEKIASSTVVLDVDDAWDVMRKHADTMIAAAIEKAEKNANQRFGHVNAVEKKST